MKYNKCKDENCKKNKFYTFFKLYIFINNYIYFLNMYVK